MTVRPLGSSGMKVSPLGLGCWQFSRQKGIVGKFWRELDDKTVLEIVRVSIANGINWFDTAEAYGWGASERSLVAALEDLNIEPESVYIADKWWPVFRRASSIPVTIQKQLNRMGSYTIALYQIHNPLSVSSIRNQLKYMADALEERKIRAIGVSNFSARMMDIIAEILADRNITLTSNQVRFNLLDRKIEKNGVLDAARNNSIAIIAWSPLAQGILTGKFHANPERIQDRPGPRKWQRSFHGAGLKKTYPLIEKLETIGRKYDKTCAQVALNWLIHAHGETVFAIPGASSVRQAAENGAVMEFQLTHDEIEEISCFRI